MMQWHEPPGVGLILTGGNVDLESLPWLKK
jgi:hypothetical protein